MARRCGAKHIFKSKCAKHLRRRAILEVPIWKNGTPLWREAHLQGKMCKKRQHRTAFWSSDVESSMQIPRPQNVSPMQNSFTFLIDRATASVNGHLSQPSIRPPCPKLLRGGFVLFWGLMHSWQSKSEMCDALSPATPHTEKTKPDHQSL